MRKLTVICGPPGSGKSTLAKELCKDSFVNIRVNQDDQGKDGHLQKFNFALENDLNIIVDRMNFNKQQRERYLKPAKEAGYETEIIVLHEPRSVCFDRMMKRQNHPTIKNDTDANNALNTFFSKYERPQEGEADSIKFIYPQGLKPHAVICDLDGTLCNLDNRLHHVKPEEGKKKNWKAFFDELVNDHPNHWCEVLVDAITKTSVQVVFASGRPDDRKRDTKQWLKDWEFPTDHLYMRCRGDHRDDTVAKEIILDFEILTRFQPLFFIDDRKRVVDLWRSRGFVCLACHEGNF